MNFKFLQPFLKLRKLYEYCCEAEEFALTKPNISATSARKGMEFMDMGYSYENAQKEAQTRVSRPGTSEHQTGLAVDLEGWDGLMWLKEHCWEYGFIVRYPGGKSHITGVIYEPWHFRYVGVEIAMDMKDTGLCLEEYLQAVEADLPET